MPFEWELLVGTAWHSLQATPAVSAPATRWRWWAPTPRTVVAVLPWLSFGGAAGSSGFSVVAARVESPWQEVQVIEARSTTPFAWVAAFTDVRVKPVWQSPQLVVAEMAGCGAGGGRPWQLPQATSAAPPVQDGVACAAPPSVAPWQ